MIELTFDATNNVAANISSLHLKKSFPPENNEPTDVGCYEKNGGRDALPVWPPVLSVAAGVGPLQLSHKMTGLTLDAADFPLSKA